MRTSPRLSLRLLTVARVHGISVLCERHDGATLVKDARLDALLRIVRRGDAYRRWHCQKSQTLSNVI
jgi:hypothetical protein